MPERPGGRLLSLSAATVLGCSPEETVAIAAETGYDFAGLRPRTEDISARAIARVRRSVASSGVPILDVEVVRLGVTPGYEIARLIDYAGAVGALHLLVVSLFPDRSRTADALSAIAEQAAPAGVVPVLEFMAFTEVPDLVAATRVVDSCGRDVGILIDALHLQRSGGSPELVDSAGPFPYIQVCDAPSPAPADGDLVGEARGRRLLPGNGELPLAGLVGALPDAIISVEVQSEEAWASLPPAQWARQAGLATAGVIVGTGRAG